MNNLLGIGYGFKEESLNDFLNKFSLASPPLRDLWKTWGLIKAGEVEVWKTLPSREALNQVSQQLSGNPISRQEFIRLARPILKVDIDSTVQTRQDFTFYLKCDAATAGKIGEVLQPYLPETAASYECKLLIWDGQDWFAEGRVLACRCDEGRYWSLTLRKESTSNEGGLLGSFFNSKSEIIDLLSTLIFGEKKQGSIDKERRGLIVVAGRTGIAKSTIARGLIKEYMEVNLSSSRTPHLLTYEDPIEEHFYEMNDQNKNYTPRQRGQDVNDIEQAINDALRQTPRILFVGETRDPGQWNQLLHFASTGHLVITTTHAGSLTETIGKILQAAKAREPCLRSIVADRLLAAIHLRAGKVSDPRGGKEVGFVLPAMWLRTPTGAKALMSEGLSSLLPNTPVKLEEVRSERPADFPPSSIGRYWFSRELAKAPNTKRWDIRMAEQVRRYGLKWDLEGI